MLAMILIDTITMYVHRDCLLACSSTDPIGLAACESVSAPMRLYGASAKDMMRDMLPDLNGV